jgi:hypothetical protein
LNNAKSVEKISKFSLMLFGKPAWEIDGLEAEVDFKVLEKINALGKDLQGRLQWVSLIGKELLKHGWDAFGTLYDIEFYKPIPFETARQELKDLGLDSQMLGLEEEEIDGG